MRKVFCNNRLRFPSRPIRRRGFTLTELVVAIGVLLLLFSLAGQVFSTTMRSTGQAKAVTELSQLFRSFEQALRDDLRHVEPGRSVMLIQCNPVNAYWTRQSKEADIDGNPGNGYPHVDDPQRQTAGGDLIEPRADMLVIFTAQKDVSHVDPKVTSSFQQVVYGHAMLGEYVPATPAGPGPINYTFQPGADAFPVDASTGYPSRTLVSAVPAERWHLARRAVQLVPTDAPSPVWPLQAADVIELQQGGVDAIALFDFEQNVLVPDADPTNPRAGSPWYLPPIFTAATSPALEPLSDGFHETVMRGEFDETPPPTEAGSSLGQYFLPKCASFKVEWALDPRSEFVAGRLDGTSEIYWFDQGAADPLAALQAAVDAAPNSPLDDLLNDGETEHADGMKYSLRDRFGAVPVPQWPKLSPDGRPNLVYFGAARRNTNGDVVAEDMFPGALRITIDVYDQQRRLERPTRHVMVIPVGG